MVGEGAAELPSDRKGQLAHETRGGREEGGRRRTTSHPLKHPQASHVQLKAGLALAAAAALEDDGTPPP